jgi:hypothetical protein
MNILSTNGHDGDVRTKFRVANTASHMRINVSQNSSDVGVTFTLAIDGVLGNQTFIVGAGATGPFEDTTHSDSIAANSGANIRLVAVGGTGTITVSLCQMNLTDSLPIGIATTSGAHQDGLTVDYLPLGGGGKPGETIPGIETFAQTKFRGEGLLKFLLIQCSGPAVGHPTTVAIRKGGVTTSMSLTETSSGIFENLVNSVAVADGDIVDFLDDNAWNTIFSQMYVEFVPTAPAVIPTVTTQAVTSITATTATGNLTVVDDGGSTVTEAGVCIKTSSGPTITDTKFISAGISGVLTANMTGLTQGQQYYCKGYATNAIGTGYGSEVIFSTLPNLGARARWRH